MKKILTICLALAATTALWAQSQPTSQTNSPTSVYRIGNTYYYDDVAMNKKEYMHFLSNTCMPAYREFQSGYKVQKVGWGLLGAGLGLDLLGSVLLGVAAATDSGVAFTPTLAMVRTCFAIGSACEIASIPTLIVGYVRMHNTVDTYNIEQKHASNNPRPYLSLNASQNGIGLAFNF